LVTEVLKSRSPRHGSIDAHINKMPTANSLAFVASFVVVFGFLYGLTSFVDSKLKAAGYDIPELILFGLPKDSSPRLKKMSSVPFLDNLRDNQYTQYVAIALAAISTLLLYIRFTSESELRPLFHAVWR
jgi:cytochrome-b5 reductase